jgi:hypothetical protein
MTCRGPDIPHRGKSVSADLIGRDDVDMPSAWTKIADVAVGGLTEVGFVPCSSLLLMVSHQGRGIVDLVSGNRMARDRRETGSWFDAARPAALGIGAADGL